MQVASGLRNPTDIQHAGGNDGRLFFVQQNGVIVVFDNGRILPTPFLDLSARISTGGERGLLGLAFSPNYANNRRFYVNYTDRTGRTVVARYTTSVDPNVAGPASESIVITQAQPFSNHNAGQLRFGPDGYLYIGMGDGGGAGDPQNNGQNNGAWLGKMLRIDVEGVDAGYRVPADNPFVGNPSYRPEIWATGLRNPWRYSFDRATGDLYIADVGQNRAEEINFQPASSRGGENYGWNLMEGLECFRGNCSTDGLTLPIHEYGRSEGCSVTGGTVYRGRRMPSLSGAYIYGDFCSGRVRGLRREDGRWRNRLLLNTGLGISTFGEDAWGEIYLADHGAGVIYRLESSEPPPPAAPGLWETRAPHPAGVTGASGAAIGTSIYSVCGETGGNPSAALFLYDTVLDVWRRGAPLPTEGGATGCNAAAAGGRLYVLGSLRDGNVYEYEPAANRWQSLAAMPVPRGASGVAVLGGRIYLAGGTSGTNALAAFDVFDTATRQWTSLPALPAARTRVSAHAVNGRIYVIAGRDDAGPRGEVFEYDPERNSWRAREPVPGAGGPLAGAALAGRIVVTGGGAAHEYDPASGAWRALAPPLGLREPVHAAAVDGRIFALGGAHEVLYLPPPEAPAIIAVSNAAGFQPALAPGAIGSLFGDRLSLGSMTAAGRIPARLNAVEVLVNGRAAALFHASPDQINFLLPREVEPGEARVTVRNAGVESAPRTFTVSAAAPGIFSLDGSGRGQGAVLIAGAGLIARATRDAFSRAPRRGEVIEIYATGLGGDPAPVVTIGGAPAEVLFAGPAPGLPGVDQVNARVPAAAAAGIAVPVTLRASGAASNEVTIAVVE